MRGDDSVAAGVNRYLAGIDTDVPVFATALYLCHWVANEGLAVRDNIIDIKREVFPDSLDTQLRCMQLCDVFYELIFTHALAPQYTPCN